MAATDADHHTWDLSDLFSGPADPDIEEALAGIIAKSERFRETFGDTLHTSGLSVDKLLEALGTYASLLSIEQKPVAYAYLLYVTNSGGSEAKALLKRTQQVRSRFRKNTAFLVAEISQIADDTFDDLIASPRLRQYATFLRRLRVARPHLLSEGEEVVLARTEPTRRKAWSELYFDLKANLPFDKLVEMEPTITHVCNAVLADRRTTDELRNYDHPFSEFALQNDISRSVIDAVADACTQNKDIAESFMAIKRSILQTDALSFVDRNKPILETDRTIPIEEASDTVLQAFSAFSPRFAELAETFFDSRWIDLYPRPGKISGGSTEAITPDHHPYIFTNYSGRPVDTVVLAHELGHGIHYLLAAENHILNFRVSPILAETASTFAEMLLFRHLTGDDRDQADETAWLARRLEDSHARIFDPLTTFLFEKRIHLAARSAPHLPTKQIRENWIAAIKDVWGNAFSLSEDVEALWVGSRNVFINPFYAFTYVFGELITQTLYAKWLDEGEDFVKKYATMLQAGGSAGPADLLSLVDVSIDDPQTWENGLASVRAQVASLAEKVTL